MLQYYITACSLLLKVQVCADPVCDGQPVLSLGGWAVDGVVVLGEHHQSIRITHSVVVGGREKERKQSECEEK